ncbi:hypothetical protein ACN47E_000296 [Coniothyrium glycines]
MFSKSSLFIAATCFMAVLAAPLQSEHRIEDIQCRCLSFSTSAKPTLCTYLESHGIDWHTAYSLASENELKIQFASMATITKVLSIPKPLPSSILRSLSEGEAQPLESAALMQSENKIICGLGDEVKHMDSIHSLKGVEPELHHIGMVVGGLTLLLIFYVAGVHLYNRFTTKEGSIMLEGAEKTLTAAMNQIDTAAPSDFS